MPPAPRPAAVRRTAPAASAPVFRAAKPAKGWTRGRAWLAGIGGIVVTQAGIAVAISLVILRSRSGEPGYEDDPARDITIAIVAVKLVVCGPIFSVLGALCYLPALRQERAGAVPSVAG